MQSVEDSPELEGGPREGRRKSRRYLLILPVLVIGLLALIIYVLYAVDNRPPSFAFLKGAVLVKVDSGFDPASGYAGKAYAYEVRGTFNDVVRKVYAELQAQGTWNVAESDHSPSEKVGVDPKGKPPSTGY